MSTENPFEGKSREELQGMIAHELSAILRNNITSGAMRSAHHEPKAEDVKVNIHLHDRIEAIHTALIYIGYKPNTPEWCGEGLE